MVTLVYLRKECDGRLLSRGYEMKIMVASVVQQTNVRFRCQDAVIFSIQPFAMIGQVVGLGDKTFAINPEFIQHVGKVVTFDVDSEHGK